VLILWPICGPAIAAADYHSTTVGATTPGRNTQQKLAFVRRQCTLPPHRQSQPRLPTEFHRREGCLLMIDVPLRYEEKQEMIPLTYKMLRRQQLFASRQG